MKKLTFGTSHFVTKKAAYDYYKEYGFDKKAVDRKFAESEIHVGEPELKEGDVLTINNEEGRYFITR